MAVYKCLNTYNTRYSLLIPMGDITDSLIDNTIKKRTKPKVAPISIYTSDDVKAMTDEFLLGEFTRITGYTHLSCKHCKGERPIHPYWMVSIRIRCEKYGLYSDVKVPLSCDKQTLMNKKVNYINNTAYRMLSKITDETARKNIKDERIRLLRSIGIKCKDASPTLAK